ncbi:MAG: hypothetical protein KUG73_07085 [Pseudomonadales bacterium]|nr:hypothetical protein [Pseudomonadales bacterium]
MDSNGIYKFSNPSKTSQIRDSYERRLQSYGYGDVAILLAQNEETLGRWWAILNLHEWPHDLPNPEPPEYGSTKSRASTIVMWIMDRIGMDTCSHYAMVLDNERERPMG